MYDLMIYSLKVGVCLAVFYLFFKLLLSRETFHRFNRIVVLGAMVLSFVLPLCVITVYREMPVLPELPAEEGVVATTVAEPLPEPFPWELLAGAAFLVGAAATLLWTLCSLVGVLRLIRSGRRERLEDKAVLVRTEQAVMPFSWGRYIVMSEKDLAENGDAILLHERAHLRLRHSFDLIVTDVAGCLQWFNPAMWLLRRELRAIHEYEADEAVLDSGVDARSYQLLLIKKAAGGRWYSVANSFNHSKLKNRITMMLCKKSSRWAGAKVLLLLPLMGVALGAFARTAYVFPEDKGKKETVTVRVSGVKFSGDGKQPLILVDGREVKTLDSLDANRIESISVLKDSTAVATYGDKGKDGVILVELKKTGEPGGAVQAAGLKGKVVKIIRTDTAGKDRADGVRVIGYGTRPKGGTVELNTDGIAKSYQFTVKSNSSLKSNPAYIVDGVQVYKIDSVDPNEIENISVLKENSMPSKYADMGYDGVITITTKRAADAKEMSVRTANAALSTGTAGIEAAREGLKQARKYMDSDAWKQAQKALDQAQKELEAAQKETASQLSETRKALDETAGSVEKITVQGKPENSVSVTTGRVTVSGAFPEGALIYINGKEAAQADVDALKPGRIKRMTVYKGDEAVKRYGEKGRKGVVEIRARK